MQHRVVAQSRGHAALGIDIREIELAAGLEQAPGGVEHRALVGDQIDHAIGDDHIEMPLGQVALEQLLDIALQEAGVGFGIAETLAVPVLVAARDRELFGRGVDPGDRAFLADHLREHIGVLPAARAQIEHMAARNRLRCDQTAAVIARSDVVVDVAQRGEHRGRRRLGGAAGVGPQIGGAGEHLAVVILRVLEIHRACGSCHREGGLRARFVSIIG